MWQYHNPVHVTCGAGTLAGLPAVVGARRVALVTFPEAAGLGLVERIRALLRERLVAVHADTQPNPDVAELAALHRAFWSGDAPCDAIVAVGGGSALDTAKVLSVTPAEGGFPALVRLLAAGTPFAPGATRPVIAVPTTAGTGSEVTPWATVWDRAEKRKYSLHLRETWPEAAIVDAELTLTLPRAVTLHSALDALSHALESIWNVNANPVSDVLAVAAARGMLALLPRLMESPASRTLREEASLRALQAGLAFSNTKTALAHSISYEMTLRHGVPHGIACSFTLPLVLARALGRRADRDAVLAQVFDESLAKAPERLATLLESLGVPTRFDAYGVTEDESGRMIAAALTGPRGRNFIGAEG